MNDETLLIEDYSNELRESYSFLGDNFSYEMNFNLEEEFKYLNSYNEFSIREETSELLDEAKSVKKIALAAKVRPHQNIDETLKKHSYIGYLNTIKNTNDLELLLYIKQDCNHGIREATLIGQRIDLCNKKGLCKETKLFYKGITNKYIKKGITVKDCELTIKWFNEVCKPALKEKIYKVRKGINESSSYYLDEDISLIPDLDIAKAVPSINQELLDGFFDSLYLVVRNMDSMDKRQTSEQIDSFFKTYDLESKGLRDYDERIDSNNLQKVIKDRNFKNSCKKFLKSLSMFVVSLTAIFTTYSLHNLKTSGQYDTDKSVKGVKKIKSNVKNTAKMMKKVFSSENVKKNLLTKKNGKFLAAAAGTSIVNTYLDKFNTFKFEFKGHTIISIYPAKSVSQNYPLTPAFLVFVEKATNKIVLEKINIVGKHCD